MSSSRPSWPWLVKGSSATSVITPRPGNSFFSERTTVGTKPSGLAASLPTGSLSDALITGNRAITGMPSFTQSSATGRSRLRRSTPGMEATASRRLPPSSTNTG